MNVLNWIGIGISFIAGIYLTILFIRAIFDWARVLIRGFRPRGILLPVANAIYAVTDPPLRALGRRIPPLRLGTGFALDLGFLILVLAVIILSNFGRWLVFLG